MIEQKEEIKKIQISSVNGQIHDRIICFNGVKQNTIFIYYTIRKYNPNSVIITFNSLINVSFFYYYFEYKLINKYNNTFKIYTNYDSWIASILGFDLGTSYVRFIWL